MLTKQNRTCRAHWPCIQQVDTAISCEILHRASEMKIEMTDTT